MPENVKPPALRVDIYSLCNFYETSPFSRFFFFRFSFLSVRVGAGVSAAPSAGKSAGESSAERLSSEAETACVVRAADVRFADESVGIAGASAAACSAEEDSDGSNGCRSCIFV